VPEPSRDESPDDPALDLIGQSLAGVEEAITSGANIEDPSRHVDKEKTGPTPERVVGTRRRQNESVQAPSQEAPDKRPANRPDTAQNLTRQTTEDGSVMSPQNPAGKARNSGGENIPRNPGATRAPGHDDERLWELLFLPHLRDDDQPESRGLVFDEVV
jgi:hypothetical protein